MAGNSDWGGIQFNVDGVTYNDSGNGGGAHPDRNGLSTLPSVIPSASSRSIATIKRQNSKAQPVTIVSKTGTNDFHGSVFQFNRNKALTARNAFATSLPVPPFNRNEFGFTFGGPIIREKTFFYGSYEGLRERFSRTNTLSGGTAAMRTETSRGCLQSSTRSPVRRLQITAFPQTASTRGPKHCSISCLCRI